jgi:Rrf2 family nitric oxide-sensitive transcriptional repressor
MISQTSEYALRAAIHLAFHPGQPQTIRQIATATGVPAGYLAKVLWALGRHGLVRATRGPNGGYLLSHNATEVSIYQVVTAVDQVQRIRCCPLNLPEHSHRLCPLHRKLDQAMATVEDSFRRTFLSELIDQDSASGRACPSHVPDPVSLGRT